MIGRAPRWALSQQTRQRRRRSHADLPHENLPARDWKYSRTSVPARCTISSLVGFYCGANRPFRKRRLLQWRAGRGCDWDGRRDEKEEMSIAEPNLGPARFRDAIKKIAV